MSIMAKHKKETIAVSYNDPHYNHKKSSLPLKNLLTQVKVLGLVGKHAGSKPVRLLKQHLTTANRRIAMLSRLSKELNKQNTAEAEQ